VKLRTSIHRSFVVTLFATASFAQTTTRVSISPTGGDAHGDSLDGVISGDGRYVAFLSSAADVAPGDSNASVDVFWFDRSSGVNTRVSVGPGGVEATPNAGAAEPRISADGRYVVFTSPATNLVTPNANGRRHVYVRDTTLQTTTLVSRSTLGGQASDDAILPSVSADGRYVSFASNASNLVSVDTNGVSDVFVHDRQTGQTTRVSVTSANAQASGGSFASALSANGAFVAFESAAQSLVTGDTNGVVDIFVRDRALALTTRVSLADGGGQAIADCDQPAISGAGRYVAFRSAAPNLVLGDTNNSDDVFLRDIQTSQTTRVSLANGGAQSLGFASHPSLSSDARFVAFQSTGDDLVSGDANGRIDVFVHDRLTLVTERVSLSGAGVQGLDDARAPSLSDDGRYVVFWSGAAQFVNADLNGSLDVFLRDRGLNAPVPYCQGAFTTGGCTPEISAATQPSVQQLNPCTVTVIDVDGQRAGLIFYGVDNTGFTPLSWGGGSSWMCVKSPLQRSLLQSSGGQAGQCNGGFTLDWNAYQQANPGALGQPWSVGAKAYVQAWFRDPPAIKSTQLSNALEMTFTP